MSRPQTIQLTPRRQHDQRNTQNFTAPSLRTTIQPRGSSIAPELELSNADRLAQSLGSAVQGVQQAQPFMEQYAQQKYEQGKLDAMQGKEETSGGYFAVRAFEKTKGEVTAHRDYKKSLQQYYVQNRLDADPEQFQAGMEQISKEFLEGQTENFLEGFVPLAMGLETQVLNQYSDFIQEETYKESLETLRQYGFEEVSTILDTMTSQAFGETLGIHSVDKLLKDNPNHYRTFFENANVKEELNGITRDVLSHMQKSGKDMGISRHEVNGIFLDYIISEAKVKGIPALLEVVFKPDESGISLMASEMSSTIDGTYTTLINNIDRRIEQYGAQEADLVEKAGLQEEKAIADQIFRSHWDDINQTGFAHPEDAIDFLTDLQTEIREDERLTHLTNSEFNQLSDKVTDGIEEAVESEANLTEGARQERRDMNDRAVNTFMDTAHAQYYEVLGEPLKEYDEDGNLVSTKASKLRSIREEVQTKIENGVEYGEEGQHIARMGSPDYKSFMEMIDRSLQETSGELNVTSDDASLMELEYNISLGEPYEQEDLIDMYNNGKLAGDDLVKYTRRNSELIAEIEEDSLKNNEKEYINGLIQNVSDLLISLDDDSIFPTHGRYLNPNTMTHPKVGLHFSEQINSFRDQNEGRYPNRTEFRDMVNDYLVGFPQVESLDEMKLNSLLGQSGDEELEDFSERADTLPTADEREIIHDYISEADDQKWWHFGSKEIAKNEALTQFNFASAEEFREADMTGQEYLGFVNDNIEEFKAGGNDVSEYPNQLFSHLDETYSSEMADFYKNYFVLEKLAIPMIEETGLLENRADTLRNIGSIRTSLHQHLVSLGVPEGHTAIALNYLTKALKDD